MQSNTKILKRDLALVHAVINYFTSQWTDAKEYSIVREKALGVAAKTKNNHEHGSIQNGYLGELHFMTHYGPKLPTGKGVDTQVVLLTLEKLVEHHVILKEYDPFGNNRPMFKANGLYTKLLYDHDLIINLVLGPEYMLEKYRKSVLKVVNIDKVDDHSIGTGFLIEHNSKHYVCTNFHVLENAKDIRLFDDDNEEVVILKTLVDQPNDLALLEIEVREASLFYLYPEPELLGNIYTIGYPSIPMTREAYQVYHKGEINSLVKSYDGREMFLFSAKSSAGNSGGPILNSAGAVVGIVANELFEKEAFQEKGKLPYFAAIPSATLFKFLIGV